LHGAIGYVTPAAKLAGRDPVIFAERDRKLAEARERRRQARESPRDLIGAGSLPEQS
jgi:putative transposase